MGKRAFEFTLRNRRMLGRNDGLCKSLTHKSFIVFIRVLDLLLLLFPQICGKELRLRMGKTLGNSGSANLLIG